jgi:hypothetical protein
MDGFIIFISVTLPDGVSAGQTIHVQSPDERINAIVVPPGFGPGSTFTVEFAPPEVVPQKPAQSYSTTTPSSTAAVPNNSNNTTGDDGFASGFQNPGWHPTTTATAVATNEPVFSPNAHTYDSNSGSYPTATAQPVYSSGPVYPK